jgi:hypothetical protein
MLGNIGRGLRTTRQFTEQVHRLACDLGIKNSDILRHQTVDAGYAGMPCKLCRDYGLLVQEDGKELQRLTLSRNFAKENVSGGGLFSRSPCGCRVCRRKT